MHLTILPNLAAVDPHRLNRLAGEDYPFMRHEFLTALEQCGCVSPATGWTPQHLVLQDDHRLLAAMPLYRKTHSRGEYVFDQQWANAYQQAGGDYYPKLLTAIPFTPCQGPRVLIDPSVDHAVVIRTMLDAIQHWDAFRNDASWHCLFPDTATTACLRDAGLVIRDDVQFQWFNRQYADFDDFLQTLTAAKRKMIRRERRKTAEQGVVVRRVPGHAIDEALWQTFYAFYAATYLKRLSRSYLTPTFFKQLGAALPANVWLFVAEKDGRAIAAALFLAGRDTLYGRYWGCRDEYDALHFEVCYYQGIEYCIEHGLARFDSGAQGEHKIARGFQPVVTRSAHWLRDARFARAVADFVERERIEVARYRAMAEGYLPYRDVSERR